MRIVIQPLSAPDHEVDVTASLVRAIAQCLSEQLGGNHVLNELEAEAHLRHMLGDRSTGARTGATR